MSLWEGDKQCSWCRRAKPVGEFSMLRDKRGELKRHSHCKSCRNDRAKVRLQTGKRKDVPKPGRMGETNPGAWKWPRDDRPIRDKLLDYELREWRGAEPGQPAWRVA